MVDVVAIAIAVLSLAGTLAAAALTGWFAFFTEERKRRSEAEKLFRKYQDPLLQATKELQSRLYSIVKPNRTGILNWMNRDEKRKANLVQYTCFLVGQYLSWTHILRRQAQFLPLSTDSTNRQLRTTLDLIESAMGTTLAGGPLAKPFKLWRGHQMAIGEIMTVKEDGELYSMGFAAFRRKWREEDAFREWFESLVEGLTTMAEAEKQGSPTPIPDHRLRRLQHLLLQLTHILDPQGLRVDFGRNQPCAKADECVCSKCEVELQTTYGTAHV